jgi:SAM-dependent methyltransferase
MIATIERLRPVTEAPTPDLRLLKARQHMAWSSGDYAVIGTTLQIVGERLAESMDLRAGHTVLDVAAGNGNMTLAAARRCSEVTCTDYVEALLASARRRAEADGLHVQFEMADAENLPFADASFDAVVSTFGAIFCLDQHRAAAELMRVTRRGGRIGLANWTPEGFIGPRCGRPGRAGARHHRSGRALQPIRRRFDGRAQRIPRSRRDAAVKGVRTDQNGTDPRARNDHAVKFPARPSTSAPAVRRAPSPVMNA